MSRPVDGASLAALRALFGALMCFGALRFIAKGWIPTVFGEPSYFFKYPGFAWVSVLPQPGMVALYSLIALSAASFAIGLATRMSGALFVASFAYAQLIDVTNYLNHYYFALLIGTLLTLSGSHRCFSVDAWLARRRGTPLRASVPQWQVWLIRFQACTLYLHAGLAKANAEWLYYGQPLEIWMRARSDMPLLGALLDTPFTGIAMCWAGFLYDLSIGLWLLLRRTRPFAYAAVLCFHLLTQLFFAIGMFPAIMSLTTLIFFSPSWPRRWLRTPAPALTAPLRRLRAPALIPLAAFVLFQALVPLRHYVLPGDVLWSEAGMRYAWKVLVREKNGAVTYRVEGLRSDGETQRYEVRPHRYLSWRQVSEISTQPDLIHQLARHVAAEARAQGLREVAVYADAWASLNGRAPKRLLRPEVDLLKVDGRTPLRSWVTAAPTEPPPSAFQRWRHADAKPARNTQSL